MFDLFLEKKNLDFIVLIFKPKQHQYIACYLLERICQLAVNIRNKNRIIFVYITTNVKLLYLFLY
jgi:hypothetical protein